MAENKLSWTELRRALMTRAGISEKEANSFLNAFNTQLVEALKQDKQVKINGLGTFKLQAVAPRKSVDVTTGEEITIEGYMKVNFTPEAGVKELIEGRSTSADSVSKEEVKEIDPLKKLGAQAEEIVDLLGELGQTPNQGQEETNKNDTDMKQANSKKGKGPKKAAGQAVAQEEPVIVTEPAVKEEPAAVEKPAEAVVEPEAPKVPEAPKAPEKPKQPKKKYHFMRDTLICVVILLLLLLVGYFFLRNQFSQWIEEFVKDKPQTEQVVMAEPEESESIEPEIVAEEVIPEEEWTYDELLLTEELTPGSRLAWVSKKYYGDKAYWPYLYEANKDILDNPSKVAIGTPIRVPKLSPAMMDTTSARFLELKERAYNATK